MRCSLFNTVCCFGSAIGQTRLSPFVGSGDVVLVVSVLCFILCSFTFFFSISIRGAYGPLRDWRGEW